MLEGLMTIRLLIQSHIYSVIFANFSGFFLPFFILAGPPRTLVSLEVFRGYNYNVVANATAGDERAMTEIPFDFTIPTDVNSCTSHLRNRGITYVGTSATIEFGGVKASSFTCQLCDDEPVPCAFTAA